MREALLDVLACPACHHRLVLLPGAVYASDGHVEDGSLQCTWCRKQYPIELSVPNFLPDTHRDDVLQTTSGFARNWNEFNDIIVENDALNDELFRDWIAPLDPTSLKGKLVLEPGCGMGRWLRVAASYDPGMLIGLDYSAVAYTAARNVRKLLNVHVVRADILHPPFRPIFEAMICLGVVHHTPDPEKTFQSLIKMLAPAGILTVWVYGAENNGWITKFVTPLRVHVTSKLPHRLLGWLSRLLAAPLFVAGHVAAVLPVPYRRYLLHLRRYPFNYMTHIVYDHLVPEIAHYLSREELERWAAQDHLHAQLSDRNGNSWRLFVSRDAETLDVALPKTG